MPKVSQQLSSTFKLPNNQWAKIVLDITDVDTDLNVEDQIRDANNALDQIYATLKIRLEQQVLETLDEEDEKIPEVD